MGTAFNIGDRVMWPARGGWCAGEVLARRRCVVEQGADRGAESLMLTVQDEETGRVRDRNIRDCCAMIPGEHVQPMSGKSGFVGAGGKWLSIEDWRVNEEAA